jgi:hypothetical protein
MPGAHSGAASACRPGPGLFEFLFDALGIGGRAVLAAPTTGTVRAVPESESGRPAWTAGADKGLKRRRNGYGAGEATLSKVSHKRQTLAGTENHGDDGARIVVAST